MEARRFQKPEVTGRCEPPDMGARNQTLSCWVLSLVSQVTGLKLHIVLNSLMKTGTVPCIPAQDGMSCVLVQGVHTEYTTHSVRVSAARLTTFQACVKNKQPGVVAHAFNPNTGRQRQEGISEFEASLVYKKVPGQLGLLQRETLFWKTKQKQTTNNKAQMKPDLT